MLSTKTYLTGAVGSRFIGEAFGESYELPPDLAYGETCATIGYGMWLWRMLLLTGEARYADLFEETLYNGILPGVSLDGRGYFYVNPLRKLHDFRVPLRWSRTRMATIPSSFCCPPNVVRTIAEAHNYVYTLSPETLWVHLYAASTLDTEWIDGGRIRLRQETDYPWSGDVGIVIDEAPEREIEIKLRIPGWAPAGGATTPGTYAAVTRRFGAGDRVDLSLDMTPAFVEAHPAVEEAFGQVTLRRGPLIYCLESTDLPEGVRLDDVTVSLTDSLGSITPQPTTIAGTTAVALVAKGQASGREKWPPNELYRRVQPFSPRPIDLTFIPYFAWGNRGDTEMTVWLPAR